MVQQMQMQVHLIAALSANNVIGVANELPFWNIPSVLKWFDMNTICGTVIMGRKTWASLPQKPLRQRLNIVMTHGHCTAPTHDVVWVNSMREAMSIAESQYRPIYIIGGSEIFHEALLRSIVDVLILTRIDLEIHHHKTAEIMLPEKKRLVWRSKEHKEDGIGGWDGIGFKFEIYKL